MEINIDKSQVMRVCRSNESLRIKIGNRELKRDDYCTREIKMRIATAKEAYNRKISQES